jgi:hypothetical protein
MSCCKHKYRSQEEAEKARHHMKKELRQNGGGHGLRKLNTYFCEECQAWHLGRSSRYQTKLEKADIPTTGELRRRLKRIDKRLDGELRHRAYLLGKIIEADAIREYQHALASVFGSAPENEKR